METWRPQPVQGVKSNTYSADMSNSIETATAIAFFGTIAIGIAKAVPKLLLITSFFYIRAFSS